jgi:hypothetical protein
MKNLHKIRKKLKFKIFQINLYLLINKNKKIKFKYSEIKILKYTNTKYLTSLNFRNILRFKYFKYFRLLKNFKYSSDFVFKY